jgi:hypothetical protein
MKSIASNLALITVSFAVATNAQAQFPFEQASPPQLQLQTPNYGAPLLQFLPVQPVRPTLRFVPQQSARFIPVQSSIFVGGNIFTNAHPQASYPLTFAPSSQATIEPARPVLRFQPNTGGIVFEPNGNGIVISGAPTNGFGETFSGQDVTIGPPPNNGWIWPSESSQRGSDQNAQTFAPETSNSLQPRVLYSAGCQSASGDLGSLMGFLAGLKTGASCDLSLRVQNY